MKYFVVVAAVFLAVNALEDSEQWAAFKKSHGKTYKSALEESLRYSIFQSNLRKIEEHNAKYNNGEETYYLGVTKFADMSSEEFKAMLARQMKGTPDFNATKTYEYDPDLKVDDSADWREKNAVTPVKDQGSCGSCWAFSACGAMEGQKAIKESDLTSLSTQELLDCSASYGNGNCDQGGEMTFAFKYVEDNGLEADSDYPYEGKQGSCRSTSGKSAVKVTGYTNIPTGDEDALKSAVATQGPISIAIDASPVQLYLGGIFSSIFCSHNLNHGVLAVGYGTEKSLFSSTDYWIVKNSWGSLWGEHGYFRLKRNANSMCGVADDAVYPTIA